MSDFENCISAFDGYWVGRHGNEYHLTKSIFVATAWVNRLRIAEGLEPLDVWVAQEKHWKGPGS